METLDWTKLAADIKSDNDGKIPYQPNKHLFSKVAFDVFQLNNMPNESLWILEEGADGEQYLVAQYDEESNDSLEIKSNWMTLCDRKAENVTLTYKDTPVKRFASSDYGFTKDDINIFQQMLIQKLSNDESFVYKLLKSQPEAKRKLLLEQFPELANGGQND